MLFEAVASMFYYPAFVWVYSLRLPREIDFLEENLHTARRSKQRVTGTICHQKKLMQRKSLYSLIAVVLTLTLISCDPCANLDCISDNYFGQFRIVSKTDGKDLVFGPNAIYDQAKIKFYSLNGTDTTFFQYTTAKFPGSGYDSVLYVSFFPETKAPAYIMLNNLDTDTLTITYNTFDTKCCGTITTIAKFKYNNTIDIPGDQGTQEIRK